MIKEIFRRMWVHNLDPTIVSLFGLEIRYYGLVYVIGFIIGIFWLMYYRRELELDKEEVYDLMFYIMLGVIIGSRVFYAVFWEPGYFLSQPWKFFYVWEGGMAYHGGLVGSIVGGWLYSRKKSFSFLKLADILSVPAVIALGLGRVANFINGELPGRVTDISFCVDFGDGECRHAYQLYSAAKRFVVAGVLVYVGMMRKWKDGFIFWLMILLMGVGRLVLDFYREDTLYWSLSTGQWMSLAMGVVGMVMLFVNHKEDLRKLFK